MVIGMVNDTPPISSSTIESGDLDDVLDGDDDVSEAEEVLGKNKKQAARKRPRKRPRMQAQEEEEPLKACIYQSSNTLDR